MRRLWRGEVVVGHDGPAGQLPAALARRRGRRRDPDDLHRVRAELARAGRARVRRGRAAHLLHRRDARPLRARGEERGRAGGPRSRAAVRVWSCFATIGDHLPEPVRLKKTVGRMATYLQAYGDLMVRDQPLGSRACSRASAPTRSSRIPRRDRQPGDHRAARARRDADSRASGSRRPRPDHPSAASTKIRGQFDLGADGVILHGASPRDLAPIVEEYRAHAPRRQVRSPGG